MATTSRIIERPRLNEDIVPFTEYRRTLSDCFVRTARTHRPIVVTQNGRATSVVISIDDFELTWDEIERCREREALSRAVEISRRQFEDGKSKLNDNVLNDMLSMLGDTRKDAQ